MWSDGEKQILEELEEIRVELNALTKTLTLLITKLTIINDETSEEEDSPIKPLQDAQKPSWLIDFRQKYVG